MVEIVREEGVSGSKLLADRPEGKRIAKLLEARRPGTDAVVVVRMDRLGRDAAEQIALLKRFRTGKVGVVAIAQKIDLATPHGRAMAQIGAIFSELERALIVERTQETLADMKAKGRVYNHAPFGWDADGDFLVPNPTEQTSLARLVDLRGQGLGYHKRPPSSMRRVTRPSAWRTLAGHEREEHLPPHRGGSSRAPALCDACKERPYVTHYGDLGPCGTSVSLLSSTRSKTTTTKSGCPNPANPAGL